MRGLTEDCGGIHDGVVARDLALSDGVLWPGDIMTWSEFTDTPLGRRGRPPIRGESKDSRPEVELGEPR